MMNDRKIADCTSPGARTTRTARFLWAIAAALSRKPLLIGCLVALASGVSELRAQSATISREYPIKAAYLYNFAGYIEWPAGTFASGHPQFVIGVLGSDPFGSILDEIAASKQVGGRSIAIRRLASVQDCLHCHLVFVSRAATPDEQEAVIRLTRGSPVLVVGEGVAFAQQGGTIGFFIEQNRVRFAISTVAAHQQHLKVSSKLLALAKLVDR